MGAPADNAATYAVAHCFPDPLVWELYASAGPPVWVEPMLEELVASLVVSQPAGAPSLAPMVASQDVEASLVDTPFSAKAAKRKTDSPPLSLVLEHPQVTPPRGTACGCRGAHQRHPPRSGCGHPSLALEPGTGQGNYLGRRDNRG